MPAVTQSSPSSLDSPDYDPIEHLNAIFSHASALSSVGATAAALQQYQNDLDEAISERVSSQRDSDVESVRRIQAAKAELSDLFERIDHVRERAVETEQSITEMTADIKKLDSTKRNLTLSMTALKRLQMLTTAYEQLRGFSKARQYRECAQLLQAVLQLVGQFKSYRSIDQIAALHRNIVTLQAELLEQICDDFEKVFTQDEVAQRRGMLSEACYVMDALGDQARSRLITWYCNTQLREYRQVFRGNDEAGSLDNISRRYSWFNRMLKTYDVEHAFIFPPHWKVGEMLASAFCEGTRDDYKAILQRSVRRTDGQPLDVNLLLSCLQETLNFEHSLERRFVGDPRSSTDTMTSKDDKPHGVGQIISEAFEPYMTLWVESQDKQLATLIPQYRLQPLRNPDEDFSSQAVIPSSTELFHFYRLALTQCAKLSTGSRFLELSKTFGKYLDQYCQQVLYYFLGERSGPQGPGLEDVILILNTADYCYLTCNQLEEKIKLRIDEEVRGDVDLQNQADSFMGVASAAIRALVRLVEVELDNVWREMRNFPWAKLESVTDQSSFMPEMIRLIRNKVVQILPYLSKPQYIRVFSDNLVDAISTLYVISLFQCKPLSEVGAEQLMLDSYVLKKGLLEVPIVTAEEGAQPPVAFVKRTNQSMAKIDAVLKTLQVRPSPPEALVQAYLIHIADRSEANFRKILELKGIRRQDHNSFVDLFNAHCMAPSNMNLPAASPLLTPLQVSSTASHTASSSISLKDTSSTATSALAGGRFDPATFGSALMNVAREGVDRISTPALSGNVSDSAQASSQAADGGHSTHLKTIGTFFKRDFSRFARSNTEPQGG